MDQPEVAGVDDEAHALAEHEDRVAAVDGVGEEHEAAGEGEVPEGDRHHRLPRPLGHDPLDQEAHGEERLAEEADHDPPELAPVVDAEDLEERLHVRPPFAAVVTSTAAPSCGA